MNELKQKLKDFEAQLSEMVMEFHTANNIEPIAYKISPVFTENRRATGDMHIFVRNNVSFITPKIENITINNKIDFENWALIRMDVEEKLKYSTNDFKEIIEPIISVINSAVGDFCSENNITYIQGEIGYVATKQNKLLKVYTDLLVKP